MKVTHNTSGYILSTILCVLLWKLAAMAFSSPVLPTPEQALQAFLQSCLTGTFWQNFGISAYRVIVSIVLSWCLAFPVGVLIGYNRHMDKALSPLIFMTYPVPKMVLLPLILLLFGLGDLSKIILISLILFFQILVAVRDGVKGIDEKYFDSMRSMGATDRSILTEVVFPAALPYSFTALRISAGTAISVLFFVESFATTSGLGYMIMNSWAKAQYTQIFVGIIGMSTLGLILFETFRRMERKVCAWKYAGEREEEQQATQVLLKARVYLRMIKFSHTIFALPFAFASVALAWNHTRITFSGIFWITVAMIGARSAAMGFNRLVDVAIDRKNPRTAERHLPAGIITRGEAKSFIVASSLVFIISSAMLSWLCFWFSFPVLGILFLYSYTKRFTFFSHIVLGIAIGMVPLGVWIALTGVFSLKIAVLGLALLCYIAGFDILYACQDVNFDREEGLYSIPVAFGVRNALWISSVLHVASLFLLLSIYWLFHLHPVYLFFMGIIALLFIIEHKLVKPDDLSHVNVAFYYVNSIISVMVFFAMSMSELLRSIL